MESSVKLAPNINVCIGSKNDLFLVKRIFYQILNTIEWHTMGKPSHNEVGRAEH